MWSGFWHLWQTCSRFLSLLFHVFDPVPQNTSWIHPLFEAYGGVISFFCLNTRAEVWFRIAGWYTGRWICWTSNGHWYSPENRVAIVSCIFTLVAAIITTISAQDDPFPASQDIDHSLVETSKAGHIALAAVALLLMLHWGEGVGVIQGIQGIQWPFAKSHDMPSFQWSWMGDGAFAFSS